MTTLFVLTQNGTRAEADEAREIFAGRSLAIGLASGHTPGQRLKGDVVVIGGGALTVEQDATGEVKRYVSMATARAGQKASASAPEPAEAPTEPEDEESPPDEPDAPEEPPDATEGMSRVDMIQHAAARWPGQRRWANMGDEELRRVIRELEAGD